MTASRVDCRHTAIKLDHLLQSTSWEALVESTPIMVGHSKPSDAQGAAVFPVSLERND